MAEKEEFSCRDKKKCVCMGMNLETIIQGPAKTVALYAAAACLWSFIVILSLLYHTFF